MKNNLRKIKMLFVLLFAIFFSCEKDLYENGLQNNANNITQKHIKLKDLDINHIKNIIIFFEKYNSLDKLNKEYLEYFNNKINEG